jgi:hypothetical protein
VVVSGASALAAVTQDIEAQGGVVSLRVPPKLFIADVPSSLSLRGQAGVEAVFTTPVALSVLEPLGDVAVAAGVKFNRDRLSDAAAANPGSFSTVRSLVAGRSLPAVEDVTAVASGARVAVRWSPLPAAVFYEVQAAQNANFSTMITRTHTDRPEISMMLPAGEAAFVRVRAVDRKPGDANTTEVFGAWSSPVSITAPPADALSAVALVPTSPQDGYEIKGFSPVFEWTGGDARVQIARSNDFKDPLVDHVAAGDVTLPSALSEPGTKLYWRVQRAGNTTNPWSATRHVTSGMPFSEHADAFVNPERAQ